MLTNFELLDIANKMNIDSQEIFMIAILVSAFNLILKDYTFPQYKSS